MQVLIIGGSADGKSEFAENLALSLHGSDECLIYIATMQPFGAEAAKRIARHQDLRKNKGFETIECYTDIESVEIPSGATILLECLGNLLANEMFVDETEKKKKEKKKDMNATEELEAKILEGIDFLSKKAKNLLLVSNDIFSDGEIYDAETAAYQNALANINRKIATTASEVYEVVCGIPIPNKAGSTMHLTT